MRNLSRSVAVLRQPTLLKISISMSSCHQDIIKIPGNISLLYLTNGFVVEGIQ